MIFYWTAPGRNKRLVTLFNTRHEAEAFAAASEVPEHKTYVRRVPLYAVIRDCRRVGIRYIRVLRYVEPTWYTQFEHDMYTPYKPTLLERFVGALFLWMGINVWGIKDGEFND